MIQNPQEHSVVAIYESQSAAQSAVESLHRAGLDGRRLSIVARDFYTEERAMGLYTWRDRMKLWGGRGAFWGTFWGLLFGGAFFFVPAVGAIEGAAVGGAAGLLAAGLAGLGAPKDTLMKYELQVRAGKFLILARGTADMIRHARVVLGTHASAARPRLTDRARQIWSAWKVAQEGSWRGPTQRGSSPDLHLRASPSSHRSGVVPPSWLLTIGAHSVGQTRSDAASTDPPEGPPTERSKR